MIKEMKQYTPADFVEAFKLGVAGKLNIDINPYNAFGIRYLIDVMNAFRYYQFDHRPKPKQLAEKLEPSEQEKFEIMRGGLLLAFDQFKATKKINYNAAGKYDFMRDCGLTSWTEEERLDIIEQAKKEFQVLHELGLATTYRRLDRIELKRRMDENSSSYQAVLDDKCKEIALIRIFRKLVRQKKELDDLLPRYTL